MNHRIINRLYKPFVLIACAAAILILGANNRQAWASQAQQSSGTVRLINPTTGEPVMIVSPAVGSNTATATVAPWEGAEVTTDVGKLVFPSGATTEPGTIAARRVDLSSLPGAASQGQLIAAMELNFYDAAGQLVAHPHFNAPVSVCFNTSSPASSQLAVAFYDESLKIWVLLPSSSQSDKACGSATHFTLFGLISGVASPNALPNASSAGATSPNTGSASATLPNTLPNTGGADTTASMLSIDQSIDPASSPLLWAAIALIMVACIIAVLRSRRPSSN